MTTPITSSTSTPAADPTSTAASTATPLDRQAFLKLLVAQISHQDPLQPMEGTEFVSQLSQFAMVEQAVAQSASLQTLSTQVGGVANNEATALVGKTVTLRAHPLTYDGVTAPTSSATINASAAKVTADVVDAQGNVVRTIDLGPRPAGPVSITWDGKDSNGLSVPQGNYTLQIHATDANGAPVGTSQDTTGTVTKVSFDKGYPELLLDNGTTGAISDLVAVQNNPAAR